MTYHGAEEMRARGQAVYDAAQRALDGNGEIIPPGPMSEDDMDLAGMHGKDFPSLHGRYGDIPSVFASFGGNDPAGTQPVIDSLWSIADALEHDYTSAALRGQHVLTGPTGKPARPPVSIQRRVQGINDHTVEWTGNAAMAFKGHFVDNINACVQEQADLAITLAMFLQGYQEIHVRANANVWDLGDKTIQLLGTLYTYQSAPSITILFDIAAAVAGVAVATGGAAIAAAAVQAADYLVGALEKTGSTLPVQGSDVSSTLEGMLGHIKNDVVAPIHKQEDWLYKALQHVSTNLDDLEHPSAHSITFPSPSDVTALKGASLSVLEDNQPQDPDAGFHPPE